MERASLMGVIATVTSFELSKVAMFFSSELSINLCYQMLLEKHFL
jgi:hypothetical protein